MTFVKVGETHTFSALASGVTAGAPAVFTITAHVPPAGAGPPSPQVLAQGSETATAGAVAHRWRTQGPPTTGDNGRRAWRVSYAVDVEVAVGQQTRALRATSQEVDVYHDWVELKTVKEDGSVYPDARFNLTVLQGGRAVDQRNNLTTGRTGTLRVTGLRPGDVRVDFRAPHQLVEWVSGTGCALKAKVRIVPQAKLVWPAPRASGPTQHKQWVNLTPVAANKALGPVCNVAVKLEGGKAGDFVWAKATYAAAMVSPRNSHTRGIQSPDTPRPAWAGTAPTTTAKKYTVVARNGGFEVDIPIQCGLAGLDPITLSVGGTEACADSRLVITSWRKVKFEEIKPVGAISSFAGNGIDAAIGRVLNGRLGEAGVEYDVTRTATYAAADLRAQESVDGAYVGKSAGEKLVFMTDTRYDAIIAAKSTMGAANGDTQTIAWADAVVDVNELNAAGTDILRNHKVARAFELALPQTIDLPAPYAVFPLDWTNTANRAVTAIRWKATHYRADDGTWTAVAAGTPGAAKMAWQNASVASAADVAKYIEFTTWRRITLKLPTAAPADAGNFLVDAGKAVRIRLECTTHLCSFVTNAYASGGQIAMTTFGGTARTGGSAEVILHETGHNMGQSVVDRSTPAATQVIQSTGGNANFGRSSAVPGLTFGTPASQFPPAVPGGYVYTGKGHQGPHCARGLSRAQRGLASFGGLPGRCIMFGESDLGATSARHYCVDCKALIRGEDLSSFRKSWWV